MTTMPSLHDLPIEATGFRFLLSNSQLDHAVLEFETVGEPIRLFLTYEQVERLRADQPNRHSGRWRLAAMAVGASVAHLRFPDRVE